MNILQVNIYAALSCGFYNSYNESSDNCRSRKVALCFKENRNLSEKYNNPRWIQRLDSGVNGKKKDTLH